VADFTARLSDGSAWIVSASSRAEAEQLVRLEDARRSESAAPPPPPGGSPFGLGAQPSPEQLEALATLPPPPTAPLLQGSPRQPQAALGAYPPPTAGMAAETGAELRAGGGGAPVAGQFIPPRQQSMLRTGLEMGGALGGIAATGGLGGIPATALGVGRVALGAGGGAALGSLAGELAGLAPSQSPGEAYRRAGEAAAFEVMAVPLGEAAAAGLRVGARQLAQLDTQLATLANQYGIRMGIEHLTTRGFLQRMRGVFGQLPFISSPYAEATKRVGGDIAGAITQQFDNVAPLTAEPFRVSQRTLREANSAWGQYRAGVNQRYDAWRANARKAGAQFSPNITRTRAQELLDESAQRSAEFTRTDPITGEKMVRAGRLQPDPLTRIAQKVADLGDGLSIDAYDGLKKDLQGISSKLKNPHDRGRVGALLEGLELDLRSTVDNANVARELSEADAYLKRGKSIFESSTAQRFGQYQSGSFEVGGIPKPTGNDIGEMVRDVFESGNRRAVNEYRALVGDRTFREAARLHLQDRFNSALQIVTSGKDEGRIRLDPAKLSRDLGLFDPGSERRAALTGMLQGTGVEVKDLENLTRLAQRAAQQEPVDVSRMISRRQQLGGFRAAMGSFSPVTGASTEPGWKVGVEALKGLTFLLESRRAARWLTDPRAVRNLTQALNPGLQQSVRTAAMIRFGRLIEKDAQAEDTGFGTARAGLGGGLAGAATRVPSLVRTPGGAAFGAGQAMLGAGLSQAAGAPFRIPPNDLEALRQGR